MEINCTFEYYDYSYDCLVTEANITKKNHLIKEFKGDHEEGKSHNDVQLVSFDEKKTVNYFPRGLQEHFPNLTELEIHSCKGIKEISKSDLKGLEGLVCLWIVNCELTSLPDDLLTEMTNIRQVRFSRNKIEFASSNILKPLIGRENIEFSLRHNTRIDACYMPQFYFSLGSIEELMKLIDEKCIKPIVVPDLVESDPKLRKMWFSGKFSDLTIITGGKKLKAHKTVLRTASKVFAEIFEDQNEATEIKIPNFSAVSVKALLKFIYTNKVSKDGNAKENFEIADKFKIAEMKSIYEKIISNQLDDSNSMEIFLFAHRFSSQLLKEKAFRLIAEKFPQLPIKLLEDPVKLKKLIDARRACQEILADK